MRAGERFLAGMMMMVICVAFRTTPGRAQGQPPQPAFSEKKGYYYPGHDTAEVLSIIKAGKQLVAKTPDSAVHLFRQALALSHESGFSYGTALALSQMANVFINLGQYDQATVSLREAVMYAQMSAQGRTELSSIYNDIARILIYRGKYQQAVVYLYQAVAIAEQQHQRNSRVSLGGIYNNLGMAMSHLELEGSADHQKILYYLERAEKAALAEKDSNLLATALANKGLIYLSMKAWDQSRAYFDQALRITREKNLMRIQLGILNNLGDLYIARDSPQRALPFLHEALAVKGSINPYYRISAMTSLAKAYLKMKQYDEAERILSEALSMAETAKLSNNVVSLHRMLAELYAATGKYQQAFRHHEAFAGLRDSISNQEVRMNVYELEVRYRSAEKDKELLQKELLISRQSNYLQRKNTWIAVSVTGVVVLALILITLYRSNLHKQRLQAEKIRSLQQEQVISQLKAMMKGEEKERARLAGELHDGIGSQLAAITINFAALKKDHPELNQVPALDDILEMIHQTASDVRKTAHNLMPDILSRYGLYQALLLYCGQVNKSGQIQIDLQVYGDISQLDQSFAVLVLRIVQELIQNTIKHARADHVVVQIRKEGQQLNIVVEDNGIGFETDKATNGLGLRQLADRVRELHGEMLIDSSKGMGTVVYIELDCSLFEKNSL